MRRLQARLPRYFGFGLGALLALPLLGLASACGDEAKPTRAAASAEKPAAVAVAKAKTQTAAEIEAELEAEAKKSEAGPAKTEKAEYVYTPIGKRDPFRSPFVDISTVAMVPVESAGPRVVGPLQRWGVEQLTLRATVTGTGAPMAMLVDPDNFGHIVKRGELVGKNWGKVTAIRRDCITITEQLRDASGAVNAIKSERCLPRSAQDKNLQEQLAKGL